MGVLQRVERKLEGAVGGAFARLFKGRVHPAEIGRALQREADEQKVVVGEGRVLVPNRYTVILSESDHQNLGEWEHQLTSTLAQLLHEQIDTEGWSTFGYVSVAFEKDKALRTGVFDVRSRVDADAPGPKPRAATTTEPPKPISNGSARPSPAPPVQAFTPPRTEPKPPTVRHALVIDGPNTRYPLDEGSNLIGRSHEAKLKLPDTGVSRRHVEVTVTGDVAMVHDLGSTNGSIVNGQRVTSQQLRDGDVIRIGHSVLVYRTELG